MYNQNLSTMLIYPLPTPIITAEKYGRVFLHTATLVKENPYYEEPKDEGEYEIAADPYGRPHLCFPMDKFGGIYCDPLDVYNYNFPERSYVPIIEKGATIDYFDKRIIKATNLITSTTGDDPTGVFIDIIKEIKKNGCIVNENIPDCITVCIDQDWGEETSQRFDLKGDIPCTSTNKFDNTIESKAKTIIYTLQRIFMDLLTPKTIQLYFYTSETELGSYIMDHDELTGTLPFKLKITDSYTYE